MTNYWKDQNPPSNTSLIWVKLNENGDIHGYFKYEGGKWVLKRRKELEQKTSGGGDYSELINSLATVATTGDYDDLIDKPEIPTPTSFKAFESSWPTSTTLTAFCQAVMSDNDAVVGMAYFGALSCSGLPAGLGIGDTVVEILGSNNNKVVHLVISSTNMAPYNWEGSYWQNNFYGWRTWENVDNKVTSINSNSTDTQYPSAKAVYNAIDAKYTKSVTGIPASDLAILTSSLAAVPADTSGLAVTLAQTLGVQSGDLYDLFHGKYEYIKFGADLYAVTYAKYSSDLSYAFFAGKAKRYCIWEKFDGFMTTAGIDSYESQGYYIATAIIINTVSSERSWVFKEGDIWEEPASGSTPKQMHVYHNGAWVSMDSMFLEVVANPTVPSGTTPTNLAGLKVGNDYFGLSHKEDKSNKVTSLSAQSTDTEYPSAKATYDAINPSVQSSQPVGGFAPNVVYDLGTITGTVTFALAAATDATIPNAYHWTFDTGGTAPTVTWPNGVIWPDGFTPSVDAGKHYEVFVRGGYASILVYTLPSA